MEMEQGGIKISIDAIFRATFKYCVCIATEGRGRVVGNIALRSGGLVFKPQPGA